MFNFADDGVIPNNQNLPVLVYRGAWEADDLAAYFENRFAEHGWGGAWRDGIFDYHHFHSNAHEVLGIADGKARVHLGGENGRIIDVFAGDILILPAGTGHKLVQSTPGFLVLGAYPAGQEAYDICTSLAKDAGIPQRIAGVPLPAKDPLLGTDGPLLQHWR